MRISWILVAVATFAACDEHEPPELECGLEACEPCVLLGATQCAPTCVTPPPLTGAECNATMETDQGPQLALCSVFDDNGVDSCCAVYVNQVGDDFMRLGLWRCD